MSAITYSVYYRTGGTENFKWQYVFGQYTREEAQAKKDELVKAGYPAHYGLTALVRAAGLPDTFSA